MIIGTIVKNKQNILYRVCLTLLLLLMYTNSFCQTKIENNWEYSSVKLKARDSTFLVLKMVAQKQLAQFIDSLKAHGEDVNYEFLVKSDFTQNGDHEHMWSKVYSFANGRFEGIFIDSPFTLKNIKTGDKITIGETDVEDWIITNLKTSKQTGYFSEKYLDSKH